MGPLWTSKEVLDYPYLHTSRRLKSSEYRPGLNPKQSQSHRDIDVPATRELLPTTSMQLFLYGSLNLKNWGYWLPVSTVHIISPLAVLHILITKGLLGLKYAAHRPEFASCKTQKTVVKMINVSGFDRCIEVSVWQKSGLGYFENV